MNEREMSLSEYLKSKLAVMPAHHRVQKEYRELKADNERLRAALSEISNMGEGYDSAMVIVADKALRGE